MASIKLKHSGGNGVIIAAPTSNPASDKTLTLPSDVDGTVVSKDSSNSLQNVTGINGGQLGNRNLIINGAMQVAQRGTSITATGDFAVDRFSASHGGTDETPTYAQVDVASGTTPYTLGFRKALRITNGNQTSGADGGDYISYIYHLEAQDVANSGWNYTDSNSFITLSFWVKSSVAQAFSGSMRTVDGSAYHYKYDTPSLSADTWTKVTKVISGNSNLQFDNDNGKGFTFSLFGFIGTNFTSSNTDTETWVLNSGNNMFANNMTSTWYTTNDATLELTGVQLEVGDTATDFEHRSFGQELALCQRYYFKLPYQGIANSGGSHISVGIETGTQSRQCVIFPRPMRALPSCAASNLFSDDEQSVTSANTVSLVYGSVTEPDRARVAFSGGSYSSGQVAALVTDGTTNTFLEGSAEL